MPYASVLFASLLLLATLVPGPVHAQQRPDASAPSSKKAFALSLLLPGLGHRYVNGGDWDGAATVYALADAGLWLGLFGTERLHDQLVSDYQTYAAMHAGAHIEGKDRSFYLNLSSYRSSDEYREAALRNRAWDQIDYVAERTNQWAWETEDNFLRFREMRADAETVRRRSTFLVGLLVANRLVSGFTALRAAGRAGEPATSFSLSPAPDGHLPMLNVRVDF